MNEWMYDDFRCIIIAIRWRMETSLKQETINNVHYLFDLLQCWHWFINFFQIAPIWVFLLVTPFGVLAFFQHSTEVHTTWIRHKHLHFGGVFSVNIRNDNSVFAFIVRFDFAHAKCDGVWFAIGKEFEATTFDELRDSLVEFKCWRWITFNLNTNISGWICTKRAVWWKQHKWMRSNK